MPTDNPILKKMRLKPEQAVLVLNAPNEQWENLLNIEAAKPAKSPFEVILIFAVCKAVLENSMLQAEKLLSPNGTIWVAFPKDTSKLQTDLTRDKGWESVPETEWSFLTLISLDKDWSAFSFRRKADKEVTKMNHKKPAVAKESDKYINMVTREITLPEDLKTVLDSNKNTKAFYEKLSFTNRREYIMWVADAKRPETRQNRILETIEALKSGFKNPRERTLNKI